MKNITTGTIVRTAALLVALLNMVLTAFGKNPLPFSDDEVYSGLSAIIAAVAALAAWWKNNSFSACARQADDMMKVIRADGATEDETVRETIESGEEQ